MLAGERRGWVGSLPSTQDLPSFPEDEPPSGTRQSALPDWRPQWIWEQRIPEVNWQHPAWRSMTCITRCSEAQNPSTTEWFSSLLLPKCNLKFNRRKIELFLILQTSLYYTAPLHSVSANSYVFKQRGLGLRFFCGFSVGLDIFRENQAHIDNH